MKEIIVCFGIIGFCVGVSLGVVGWAAQAWKRRYLQAEKGEE